MGAIGVESAVRCLTTAALVIPSGSVAELLVVLAPVVGMGLLDGLLGSDDGDADGDGGDFLFEEGEEGGDDIDMGGMDEMGGMDDMGGMDEMGDVDDAMFDDESGGGGGSVAEIENRVDDLEDELASVSSTVSTVRSENEEISETVDEVEEQIRKLLDIYEMVTKGVNPFVDDVQPGGGMGGGEESLGLFESDDDEPEEDLDSEVADEPAESFFEDDFDDADGEDALDAGESMAMDAGDGPGDDIGGSGGTSDDSEGGKSFEELKQEYESGEADWAEEASNDAGDAADGAAESAGMDAGDEFGEEFGDELGDEFEGATETAMADGATATVEPTSAEPGDEPVAEDPPEEPPAAGTSGEPAADAVHEQSATEEATTTEGEAAQEEPTGDGDGKPYLRSIPEGYVAEVIVMEWLEFLIEHADRTAAGRALDYYERLDWIDEEVARDLQSALVGLDGEVEGEGGDLTLDHHLRSLGYISQLGDSTPEGALIDRMRGGSDGL